MYVCVCVCVCLDCVYEKRDSVGDSFGDDDDIGERVWEEWRR